VLVNRTRAIIALLLFDFKSKMSISDDHSSSHHNNRWYDKDPAMVRALEQLRNAPDNYQAQVALNIIKIIVEHQMEGETEELEPGEPHQALPYRRSWDDHRDHRRWYDVHETLSSAIQLLADSPEDLQKRLIPSIAHMIEATLNSPKPD
jgi:hypothetical protein